MKAQLHGANVCGKPSFIRLGEPDNTQLCRRPRSERVAIDRGKQRVALSNAVRTWIKDEKRCQEVLDRFTQASASGPPVPPLKIQSGLAEPRRRFPLQRKSVMILKPKSSWLFKKELHAYLAGLACESPWIAQGLLHQILDYLHSDSSRQGLGTVFKSRLDDKKCQEACKV